MTMAWWHKEHEFLTGLLATAASLKHTKGPIQDAFPVALLGRKTTSSRSPEGESNNLNPIGVPATASPTADTHNRGLCPHSYCINARKVPNCARHPITLHEKSFKQEPSPMIATVIRRDPKSPVHGPSPRMLPSKASPAYTRPQEPSRMLVPVPLTQACSPIQEQSSTVRGVY